MDRCFPWALSSYITQKRRWETETSWACWAIRRQRPIKHLGPCQEETQVHGPRQKKVSGYLKFSIWKSLVGPTKSQNDQSKAEFLPLFPTLTHVMNGSNLNMVLKMYLKMVLKNVFTARAAYAKRLVQWPNTYLYIWGPMFNPQHKQERNKTQIDRKQIMVEEGNY